MHRAVGLTQRQPNPVCLITDDSLGGEAVQRDSHVGKVQEGVLIAPGRAPANMAPAVAMVISPARLCDTSCFAYNCVRKTELTLDLAEAGGG